MNFVATANYEGYSRNYARAWEICCPNMWPHKPKSKSHWCQKRFVYLRRREEPLRPPVYWPCIISVHQESWQQRWKLLRTVLRMGKIKGIIRVRCVETSMLHLTVNISRHLKIRLVRPSLTFLGHDTLLIWQDWLVFTAVFSVTSIYLENATTPPP